MVLGIEADVEGIYSRQPLTLMQATLASTRRSDGDEGHTRPGDPCSKKAKRNPDGDEDAKLMVQAPRLCILARCGSRDVQVAHRRCCENVSYMQTFRTHGLDRIEGGNCKRKSDEKKNDEEGKAKVVKTNGEQDREDTLDYLPGLNPQAQVFVPGRAEDEQGNLRKRSLNPHADGGDSEAKDGDQKHLSPMLESATLKMTSSGIAKKTSVTLWMQDLSKTRRARKSGQAGLKQWLNWRSGKAAREVNMGVRWKKSPSSSLAKRKERV